MNHACGGNNLVADCAQRNSITNDQWFVNTRIVPVFTSICKEVEAEENIYLGFGFSQVAEEVSE